jgi:hypothetical protein
LLDNATITIAVIENKLKNNNKYPSDINRVLGIRWSFDST